jgi:putative restriction endonuclease
MTHGVGIEWPGAPEAQHRDEPVTKGVFDTKPGSRYDDDVAVRYHFPSVYLNVAQGLVGDWVVYREPRRNQGREAYVAVARVARIEPDPALQGHHYAYVTNYEPFHRVVPFKQDGRYAERELRALPNARQVGRTLQGRSIRSLDEHDFAAIVRQGLSEVLDPANARKLNLDEADPETAYLLRAPPEEQERRIEQILVNRKFRDAGFRGQVCAAYDNMCAFTGLKIINGGGRAEVQAAHIVPVADGGPDIVQNGLALSSTVHWLFDRHLISISEDYRPLISHNRVPSEVQSLFHRLGPQIKLPDDKGLWPRESFLTHHRARFAGYHP